MKKDDLLLYSVGLVWLGSLGSFVTLSGEKFAFVISCIGFLGYCLIKYG